ncbi:MAG: SpoIIE family protein phosphatase [Candidatus Omnitrophica bacterium]|nr:SpoIIE family protein phosphatase [Candidatus Omnitrophota bacterium]
MLFSYYMKSFFSGERSVAEKLLNMERLRSIRDIPGKYLPGFIHEQTSLIRSRVNLFCALVVFLYFFTVAASLVMYPEQVIILDILLGVLLLLAAAVIFYFNQKATSLTSARFNAYIFTALMLAVLVKLSVVYRDDPVVAAATFVFTVFFVSVTIPWKPLEVIAIGLMHLVAYSASFLRIRSLAGTDLEQFGLMPYLDGFIFIIMAVFLCVVVRRAEMARDVQNYVLFKEVEEKSDQMRRELELATRIHKTLVPPSVTSPRVDIAVSYLPVYYMGGDYAKYKFLDEDRFIFIICDVTGHGVSAALLVNRVHAEFERLAQEGKSPGVLLRDLNSFIEEDFEGTEMYLSAFCGMVDLDRMRLTYSSYGHPPQYVYHARQGNIVALKAQASLLGVPFEEDLLHEKDLALERGDRVLLFTDGLTETAGGGGEQYGDGRLEAFIAENKYVPAEEFNRALLKDVELYRSGKSTDDIFILDIGIKGLEKTA